MILYSAKDSKYAHLANITPSTVVLNIANARGEKEPKVFANATAAYAYLCTDDDELKSKLLHTLDVKKINYFASPRGGFVEPESPKLRRKLMKRVLRAKFITGHPFFSTVLLATGDEELCENRFWEKTDSFWGKAKDGTGSNEGGKLLAELREELVLRKAKRTSKKKSK